VRASRDAGPIPERPGRAHADVGPASWSAALTLLRPVPTCADGVSLPRADHRVGAYARIFAVASPPFRCHRVRQALLKPRLGLTCAGWTNPLVGLICEPCTKKQPRIGAMRRCLPVHGQSNPAITEPVSNAILGSVACPVLGSCVAIGIYTDYADGLYHVEPMGASEGTSSGGGTGGGSPGGASGGGSSTPSTSSTTSTTTTSPATTAATGSVSFAGTTISVTSSGKATIKLACTGTGTCGGKLTLTAKTANLQVLGRPLQHLPTTDHPRRSTPSPATTRRVNNHQNTTKLRH